MNRLEKIFGGNAQTIALEHLLENRGKITYLSGIAKESGLSHSTVTRVMELLLEKGIVKEIEISKQTRTFTLNEDNRTTKLLIGFMRIWYSPEMLQKLDKIFGGNAQLTVLECLLQNRGKITYLSGIAKECGISHSSVARVIEPLSEMDLVKEIKISKQTRTFALNEDNEITKLLVEFYKDLNKII
jgi:Ferric uptake regulator family.